MHTERSGYAISSFLAGLLSLLVMLLEISTIGDTRNLLRVQVYFSWLIPFALVLVADQNPYGLHNIHVSLAWHTRARVLGALGGMVQSVAFAIWAMVIWAEKGSAVQPFFPIVISILALQTLVLLAIAWALATVDKTRHE